MMLENKGAAKSSVLIDWNGNLHHQARQAKLNRMLLKSSRRFVGQNTSERAGKSHRIPRRRPAFSLCSGQRPGSYQPRTKASAEHKTIFVHFGASWCGWCKRLDAFLDGPEIKPVFERYFVPVKLVVMENDKNKALENPGADNLMKTFGGPSGLPYSAFL